MDKKDCLERKCTIWDIGHYINQYKEQSLNITFGMDGKWGAGKSFILKEFEESYLPKFKEGDKYLIFHYNCCQYDYYEEPLIAIVSMIIKELEESNINAAKERKENEQLIAKAKAIKLLFISCLSKPIEILTKININEIIQTINSKAGISTKKFDDFKDFNDAFKRLVEFINEWSKEKNKTVLFLVDELDRCLPEYAIKILERLHHISERLQKCITVIAVDKQELLHSVQYAFGYSSNEAEKFLRKYVDFFTKIDNGKLNYEIYDNFDNLYFRKFKNVMNHKEGLSKFMKFIFRDLVIREQEHIIDLSNAMHSISITDLSSRESDIYKSPYSYEHMLAELFLTVSHLFYFPNSEAEIKEKMDLFSKNYYSGCASNDEWNLLKEYIENLESMEREKKMIENFSDLIYGICPFRNE